MQFKSSYKEEDFFERKYMRDANGNVRLYLIFKDPEQVELLKKHSTLIEHGAKVSLGGLHV